MEHESDGDTKFNWCAKYRHQRIDKGDGGLGNKRTNGDDPNYRTVEIGPNIKENSGDSRRLAVPQIPMEDHQLKLMLKTLK